MCLPLVTGSPPKLLMHIIMLLSFAHRATRTPICRRSCLLLGALRRAHPIAVSMDMRVPRVWEEWGRVADHAEPQTVIESTASVGCHLIGSGLHVSTAVPKFLEDDWYASSEDACANVLESVPGGAPVIPWASWRAWCCIDSLRERATSRVVPVGTVTRDSDGESFNQW